MSRRIILIPKDDLVYYPPTISLINVLNELGIEVVCVGHYSDFSKKKALEKSGVTFIPIYNEIKDVSKFRLINWISIIFRGIRYSYKIKKFLVPNNIKKDDLIWFIYSSSIASIQKYIEKYPYVVQFYEFENFSLNWKSKILTPSYSVERFFNKAKALIHCEYNRAAITNGLYGINKKYYILPNKPIDSGEQEGNLLPEDVRVIIDELWKKTKGKKIILYQGIFDSAERRLEEFCEAISFLPDDYVFVAMGGGRGGYFAKIKKEYESERIFFIPFIRPPYHLQITQLSRFGVLTYHPAAKTYVDVLNPLFCAPNKIFEFGKYGIPMIANDVPGLKMIFSEFKCGMTIETPITPEKIAENILLIDKDYDAMSRGSKAYFESVDIESIVSEIISL